MDMSRNNPFSIITLEFVIDSQTGYYTEVGSSEINPKRENPEADWCMVTVQVRGNFTMTTETVKRIQDALKPPTH